MREEAGACADDLDVGVFERMLEAGEAVGVLGEGGGADNVGAFSVEGGGDVLGAEGVEGTAVGFMSLEIEIN